MSNTDIVAGRQNRCKTYYNIKGPTQGQTTQSTRASPCKQKKLLIVAVVSAGHHRGGVKLLLKPFFS